jgi:hypothetical protein
MFLHSRSNPALHLSWIMGNNNSQNYAKDRNMNCKQRKIKPCPTKIGDDLYLNIEDYIVNENNKRWYKWIDEAPIEEAIAGFDGQHKSCKELAQAIRNILKNE